jgi:hypothetical protein
VNSRRSAVLIFHGGCWRTGSKNDVHQQVAALADAGFTGILVQYRLLDTAPLASAACSIPPPSPEPSFTRVGAVKYRLRALLWRLNVPKRRAVIRWHSRLDRLHLRLVMDDDDRMHAGKLTTDMLAAAARTLEADAVQGGRLRRMYWARADSRTRADLESCGIAIVPGDFRYYLRERDRGRLRTSASIPSFGALSRRK